MTDTLCTLTKPKLERKTYTVPEIAIMIGIGRNTAYALCNSGQFRIIKVGRAIKVVKPSFDAWLTEGCK
jgi:excisionase family DNA binding protein